MFQCNLMQDCMYVTHTHSHTQKTYTHTHIKAVRFFKALTFDLIILWKSDADQILLSKFCI